MRAVSKRTLQAIVGVALAAACAVYLVVWAARGPATIEPVASGGVLTRLPQPKPLDAFGLVDHEGRVFDHSRLQGAWTLLFFGYTSCPDICPTTLVELGRLRRELEAQGASAGATRLVFVSVDPGRDDQSRLGPYVRHFDPQLTGVTGEPAELARFAAQFGAAFELVESAGPDYPVYHTSAVFVVDPRARFSGVLRSPLGVAPAASALLELRRDDQD